MAFHNVKNNWWNGSGGGDVTIEFTEGLLDAEFISTTSNFTIPEGAYHVEIYNAGAAGGGAISTATINGNSLFPGAGTKFDYVTDWQTKEVLKVPELIVVTNGATIWYKVSQHA